MNSTHRAVRLFCTIAGLGPGIFAGVWFADNNSQYATTPAGVWLGGLLLFSLCVVAGAAIGSAWGDILNLLVADE